MHVSREIARLAIVDQHEVARAGLRSLLTRARGLLVVGEAASGCEALAMCARLRPSLILADLHLGDMDGLTLTRVIGETCPTTRVVLFSMYEGQHYELAAERAGAAGYLLKG